MTEDTCTLLWQAIEAAPSDDSLKLALVDALIESDSGDRTRDVVHPRDVAHCIRLLVKMRRWPKKCYDAHWAWASGKTGETPKTVTHVLPSPWYLEFKKTYTFRAILDNDGLWTWTNNHRTCCNQIVALTAALVRLRNQLDADW